MNFWIEKTIVKGRPDRESGERALGKTLWSPQKDKRGADIYKNMRLVKKGATNQDISNEIHIELSTVKTHVSNIFSKLKIKSRKEIMDMK